MMTELKRGERLDELQRNGYRIIQKPGRFCFGMDAVLLSSFARVKEGERESWIWEQVRESSRFCCVERRREEILQVLRFRKKAQIWQGAVWS